MMLNYDSSSKTAVLRPWPSDDARAEITGVDR